MHVIKDYSHYSYKHYGNREIIIIHIIHTSCGNNNSHKPCRNGIVWQIMRLVPQFVCMREMMASLSELAASHNWDDIQWPCHKRSLQDTTHNNIEILAILVIYFKTKVHTFQLWLQPWTFALSVKIQIFWVSLQPSTPPHPALNRSLQDPKMSIYWPPTKRNLTSNKK